MDGIGSSKASNKVMQFDEGESDNISDVLKSPYNSEDDDEKGVDFPEFFENRYWKSYTSKTCCVVEEQFQNFQ